MYIIFLSAQSDKNISMRSPSVTKQWRRNVETGRNWITENLNKFNSRIMLCEFVLDGAREVHNFIVHRQILLKVSRTVSMWPSNR